MFRPAVLLIISQIHYARLAPTENYPNSERLDSNYMLYWKNNDTHITFETHVDANGYTGFGISKDGSMFPSDVVMGYVLHNKAYLKDYHTTAYAPPIEDNSQDWVLITGKHTQGSTMLKFTRSLITHDDNDVPIHAGITHVIWSYSDSDPQNFAYHGSGNRGTKDIKLIAKDSVPVGK